jgi:hypothetical protein
MIVTSGFHDARKNYAQTGQLRIASPLPAIKMPGMNRHCWKCGCEWTLSGLPGRGESCHQCGSDLRVCLNCISYDPRAAYQCRDRRAEPVFEKHTGNFCEYFDFVRRVFVPKNEANPRESSARDVLKKLLGD